MSTSLNARQDERRQTLAVNCELVLEWYDPFLSWNQTEYPVRSMRLDPNAIWRPDVILYNRCSIGMKYSTGKLRTSDL
jgi:hypothetical protein